MSAMPKNRVQGIVFGVLMSVTMAYGMEVFNVAWKMGFPTMLSGFSNMTNDVFLAALVEASYMWILVFIFSNLWGNRLGAKLAAGLVDPSHDNAFLCTLVRSGCTVLVMCPTMSLVASVLFNVVLAGASPLQLPAIWVGTVLKNFPMALLWNLFAAGPLSRLLFARCFSHLGEKQRASAWPYFLPSLAFTRPTTVGTIETATMPTMSSSKCSCTNGMPPKK